MQMTKALPTKDTMEAYPAAPWVEKYRPLTLEGVVLGKTNKQVFATILACGRMPNLLAYGPPGTGKTTAILNLVHAFVRSEGCERSGMIIHLNASDDRGIDVIRSHVARFASTKGMFKTGTKFVILDEADYMTKSAQQALKQVIRQSVPSVRFCLICNYIARLDGALQNELVQLRFDKLPEQDVTRLLSHICASEGINVADGYLAATLNEHRSDVRRMINHMQLNQGRLVSGEGAADPFPAHTWGVLLSRWAAPRERWDPEKQANLILDLCEQHNQSVCAFLKALLGHLVRSTDDANCPALASSIESLCSLKDADASLVADFAARQLRGQFLPRASTRASSLASHSPGGEYGGQLSSSPASVSY
jgi:hypothetical protein